MSRTLDMDCSCRHEDDGTFTVTVKVRQCHSVAEANTVAGWIRGSLKGNIEALGTALSSRAHFESEAHQ